MKFCILNTERAHKERLSGHGIPWGDIGFLGEDTGFLGGDTGFLGEDTGFIGGDTGFLGGDTGFPKV